MIPIQKKQNGENLKSWKYDQKKKKITFSGQNFQNVLLKFNFKICKGGILYWIISLFKIAAISDHYGISFLPSKYYTGKYTILADLIYGK